MISKILDLKDIRSVNESLGLEINSITAGVDFIENLSDDELGLIANLYKISHNILIIGFNDLKYALLSCMNSSDRANITFLTTDHNIYISSLQFNDQNVEVIKKENYKKKYLDYILEDEKLNQKIFFEYFEKIDLTKVVTKKKYDLVFINLGNNFKDFFNNMENYNYFRNCNFLILKIDNLKTQNEFCDIFQKKQIFKIKDYNLFIFSYLKV